jgi:hypothetical protein
MSREEMLQDPVVRTLVVRAYKSGQIAEARRIFERDTNSQDQDVLKKRIEEIIVSSLDARELDLELTKLRDNE